VSGVDFKVNLVPRRPGDPAALVADAARIRQVLGWKPELDDLKTIVTHAYAWESKLATRLAKAG
jgi:UDP-glucose 4-epimerase